MKKQANKVSQLLAVGAAFALLGSGSAWGATAGNNLKVTKNFFGGYNASIELDDVAKAAVTSSSQLSFKLGHAVKSVYGATIGVSDMDRSIQFYSEILGYDHVVFDKSVEIFIDLSMPFI